MKPQIRTFVDADVLIYAARGVGDSSRLALNVLSNPDRIFVSSNFVTLEVIPKARYHGREIEAKFYQTFFEAEEEWASPFAGLVNAALHLATTSGLSAMDALHIAAAQALEADEFITGEKPTSPLFRVSGIRVVSLFDKDRATS